MAHCLKKMILLMAVLSLVILLSVVDRIYNREESGTGGGGLGLRHLSNIPSLKRLIADGISATGGGTETGSNGETAADDRATESYTPYDAFYVAPNWTVFDVRRRKNTHRGLEKLNYTRGEFPELLLDGSSNALSGSVSNSTRDTAMLIYNRVPKSGSSTVRKIVARLSKLNGFSTFMSGVYASHSMPIDKEREFTNYVVAGPPQGKSLVYDRHMYYINVERYLRDNTTVIPNWFNFVRHPVKRFESDFYYLRSASRWNRFKSNRPNKQWFGLTLDKCIETNATECDFSVDKIPYRELQLTFFCGNAPECRRTGSRDALAQAMLNVERGYAFVGTTEQMELGLAVLEAALPRFFEGAQKVFKGMSRVNVNKHQGMSAKSRETLEKHLATDIEFYNFVRQRLERMAHMFGVGPKVRVVPDQLPGFP